MKKLIILFFMLKTLASASIGYISAINGKAMLMRGSQQHSLQKHSPIENKDIIKTMKNSKLQIIFNDKTIISLGQKATFKIDDYLFSKTKVKAKFHISKGIFKSITGKIGKIAPQNFKLKTQNATIGVRGTTIIGETSKDSDSIICSSGKIIVTNSFGQVEVNKGEKTIVKKGYKPTSAMKISKVQINKIDKTLKSTNKQEKSVSIVENVKKELTKEVSYENAMINLQDSKNQWGEWDSEQEITKEDSIDKDSLPKTDDKEKLLPQLQHLRDKAGTRNPTYTGTISGSTMYPSKQNSQGPKILAPDKDNYINLHFDLGVGTMNGEMKFKTDDSRIWKADIKGGQVDKRGQFDFGLQNRQNVLQGSGNGMLSGENLQNADGSFILQSKVREDENYIKAFGTFTATKQLEEK